MQTDVFYSYRFDFEEVRPGIEDIKLFLKSDNFEENHPANIAIREIMLSLADNKDVSGGYIIKKAETINLSTGAQIAGYLKKAEYLALFVCTAGALFTELTGKYNKEGNYLEAFIVDAIGSFTVEKAMDKIQTKLEFEMQKEGMNISNRYSPGYCEWPVSFQRELFDYMGELPVEISLTESCLMLPIKSVSGVIGIGSKIQKRPYSCQICKNKECSYRRIIQST